MQHYLQVIQGFPHKSGMVDCSWLVEWGDVGFIKIHKTQLSQLIVISSLLVSLNIYRINFCFGSFSTKLCVCVWWIMSIEKKMFSQCHNLLLNDHTTIIFANSLTSAFLKAPVVMIILKNCFASCAWALIHCPLLFQSKRVREVSLELNWSQLSLKALKRGLLGPVVVLSGLYCSQKCFRWVSQTWCRQAKGRHT